jgi:hypothetical protein
MEATEKLIARFFNLSEEDLKAQDEGLLTEMKNAIEKDEFMRLHQLGYELKEKKIYMR